MKKIEKQAERLEEYLRNVLGWETFEVHYECTGKDCGRIIRGYSAKFCMYCGKKLKAVSNYDDVIADLKNAIKYANEKDK